MFLYVSLVVNVIVCCFVMFMLKVFFGNFLLNKFSFVLLFIVVWMVMMCEFFLVFVIKVLVKYVVYVLVVEVLFFICVLVVGLNLIIFMKESNIGNVNKM